MDLKDRVALITGASSGIGAAIAGALASSGMRLVLTGRNDERLTRMAQGIHGVDVTTVTGDVTVAADCEAIVQHAVDQFGTVDLLVNNAGYGPPGTLLETTEAIWDATVDSCLKSVYLMTRAALPLMIEQNRGAIVQISSVAGLNGYGGRTAYCAAKWGVQGFTAALREELSGTGIRCHTLNPGAVATPWWGNTNDAQDDDVLTRMIQPEHVAEALRWLLTQPPQIQVDQIALRTFRSPWEG